MAWLDGRVIPAVVIGGLALIGVALEILTSHKLPLLCRRGDHGAHGWQRT
jgi:hypothetical protein